MTARRFVTTLVLLAVAGSVLAGCGRRNAPITPYEAAVEERERAEEEGRKPLPPKPSKPTTDRPFILDALID